MLKPPAPADFKPGQNTPDRFFVKLCAKDTGKFTGNTKGPNVETTSVLKFSRFRKRRNPLPDKFAAYAAREIQKIF